MPLFAARRGSSRAPAPIEIGPPRALRCPPRPAPTTCCPLVDDAPTPQPRKRRTSIRHSLASTFSFASLSTLRRRPSLASTKPSTVAVAVATITNSPSTPKPRVTLTPHLVASVNKRLPVIIVDSPPRVQTEDAPEDDASDGEWSRSKGGGKKRREGRTTINDARLLALLTMDISHPVLLASSYSGQVRDLPGRSGRTGSEGKPKERGLGGDVSVKQVVELLERVSMDPPSRSRRKDGRWPDSFDRPD